MSISYLGGRTWSDLSREERFYCARLFERARERPGDFAAFIASTTGLALPSSGAWDIGFEVCFYRDLLWHAGHSAREARLSSKRTFDLCLFHEDSILVLEAKVCEPFKTSQLRYLADDLRGVRQAVGRDIDVRFVALASSRYFRNHERHGDQQLLSVFHGRLTWEQLGTFFGDPLLTQADRLYKSAPVRVAGR